MTAPNDPLASMGEPGIDPASKDADSGRADGARTREGLKFSEVARLELDFSEARKKRSRRCPGRCRAACRGSRRFRASRRSAGIGRGRSRCRRCSRATPLRERLRNGATILGQRWPPALVGTATSSSPGATRSAWPPPRLTSTLERSAATTVGRWQACGRVDVINQRAMQDGLMMLASCSMGIIATVVVAMFVDRSIGR
jgi:hypothetical protein